MAVAPSNTVDHHALLLDQSPHLFLLPLGAADGERRRTERLRRRHLGPVLLLPGLQRTRRLDAHFERRRCCGRVSGNRHEEGRSLTSTSTATKSARCTESQITVPYKTDSRDGREEIHRLSHAPRAHRSRGQREMGDHPPDAGAHQGAEAILLCAPRRRTTNRTGRPWS